MNMEHLNINQILKKKCNFSLKELAETSKLTAENLQAAIKEIVEAVVDKCDEQAKIDGGFTHPSRSIIVPCGTFNIHQESILNVKKMVKYE